MTKEEITQLIEDNINQIKEEFKRIHGIELNEETLTNTCDLLQAITYYTFKDLGFNVYPIQTQKVISKDVEGHSALLIELNGYSYLVDLTYIQFFKNDKCNKDNYIIDYKNNLILLAPLPGYYYKLYEEDKWVADILLEKGYIEAAPQVLKIYCDSFYLTKRGIYTGDLDTKSNISGQVYLNSIYKNVDKIYHTKEYLQSMGYALEYNYHEIKR